MRIDQILAGQDPDPPGAGGPTFSFEFFPPKTEKGEQNLYAALAELRELEPSFVSVTYGAGGSTREKTIEIVKRVREQYDLEAMAHFTCVGATVAQLRETLDEMLAAGIDNVLALRGDPPAGVQAWVKTEGGLEYSHELVRLIPADYPFAIGAACFPETHIHAVSPEADLALPGGEGAGRRRLPDHAAVLRQRAVLRLHRPRARGRDRGADHPRDHADHPRRPGRADGHDVRRVDSRGLRRELQARAEHPEAVHDFGVAYATLQCAELLAAGAPGIHFYTLNRSPATRAILSALKLAKPWEKAMSAVSTIPVPSSSTTRGEPSAAS